MRTLITAGVVSAVVAALAIPGVHATADAPTTLRYVSTDPVNTDLDLGEPGLSPGDRQVFVNKAVRGGKQIGYETGEAVIVEATDEGLKVSITSTLVLPHGTLTSQAVFVERFAQGPGAFTAAITGGTGRYRGATGESRGEFIAGTDSVRITVRLR